MNTGFQKIKKFQNRKIFKINVQIVTPTEYDTSTNHTLVVRNDYTLWAWGLNATGQLGDNSLIARSSPIQIGTDTNWSTVSTGGGFSHGIRTDGTLWSWGTGGSGVLGDGTVVAKLSPVQIGTLTNWSKVSSNTNNSFAIKTDGTLWAWGFNGTGYTLGLNDTANRSSPTQVGTGNTWSSVSAGLSHGMAIKSDNTLWGWGFNSSGQIGDNSTSTRFSPIQIGTLTNWASVASGQSHTMAVKTDGTLWGWGNNSSGQVGDTTTVSRSSPVQIGTDTNWSTVSVRNATLTSATVDQIVS